MPAAALTCQWAHAGAAARTCIDRVGASTYVVAVRDSIRPDAACDAAPRALYERRLAAARRAVEELAHRERAIGNYRLAVFIGGIAVAWLAIDRQLLPAVAVALPLLAFAGLVIAHDRTIRRRRRAQRIAAHYAHGLARIDGTWSECGQRGERFADPHHPYAADLDLFGRGSLFQLLCIATTTAGQATLAAWLKNGTDAPEVAARQAAVAELRDDVDRRERLALGDDAIASAIDPDHLAAWASRPVHAQLRRMRLAAALLVAASAATFALQGLGIIPPAIFLAAVSAQAAFGARCRRANLELARSLELAPRELTALARLLREIENGDFTAARLGAMQQSIRCGDTTASAEIARLHRLIQLLDARRNILFAPLAAMVLWTSQVSLAIEAWRRTHGPHLAAWLAAAGDYESLCALAGFAFEQPETSFPSLEPSGIRFHAIAARHPLLPFDRSVTNDVVLDDRCSLLIVSGSNMSGKSTLLRTVGTNAVLAQAGAPVCATSLVMSPLQIGTSMRTQDSLLDGTSHFYAEIKRLKLVVDLAGGDIPLLFLLDEILHGTNSHDRGVGAEAVVRTLLDCGAIGLITTHDLTLAQVADNLAPRARNVHFADRLIGGEMTFDYKMHDGPVRKSNALGLMRAIGLEV